MLRTPSEGSCWALASPGCATRYSLCLSPHILQISRKPSIQQCTDCGLKRWHSTIPTICSACTDFAKPSGRILRPVPFPHSSGTQSIQINAAKVECYSHFSPLPSRAGVPWTTEKDSVQWSNAHKRQISLEGEGWKELWFRCLISPLLFHWKRNRKSDLKWIPPSRYILALYRVPFLLRRVSEGHASCLSILYRTSALHVLILVCRIRQGRHDLTS